MNNYSYVYLYYSTYFQYVKYLLSKLVAVYQNLLLFYQNLLPFTRSGNVFPTFNHALRRNSRTFGGNMTPIFLSCISY